MHGVGVSKRVRAYVLVQASAVGSLSEGIADGLSAERLSGKLSGEQPWLRS
jgi:hypothetical protein